MPGFDPVRRKGKDKAIERAQRNGKYTARSVRQKEARTKAAQQKRVQKSPDPPDTAQKNP